MPWWGWIILAVVVVVVVPIKIKILKKMLAKKEEENTEDF